MTTKKSKYWAYPETEYLSEHFAAGVANATLWIVYFLAVPFFALCIAIACYEGTKSPDSPYGINVEEPNP